MPSRRERDFVSYFNGFWYRDFPITESFQDVGRAAVWTSHIASVVKRSADLMGAFTCYETGHRTDAVIEFVSEENPLQRSPWAWAEWEWRRAHTDINEIQKLAFACRNSHCNVAIFAGYCEGTENIDNTLERISQEWHGVNAPLLCFLVTFEMVRLNGVGRRSFQDLYTFRFYKQRNGHIAYRMLRPAQPALPWEVAGTRWWAARTAAKRERA